MVGAFITEPKGSMWPENGPLMADVKSDGTTLFREFVNVLQNNVYLYGSNPPIPSATNKARFFNAINYATGSMAYRYKGQTGTNPTNSDPKSSVGIAKAFSNKLLVPGSPTEWGDPRPVWRVERKRAFRLRMVHPDGLGGFPDDVIKLHGHVYGEEPYIESSTKIGTNRNNNWTGGREGFGPGNSFDLVIASAGGRLGIPGDYLFASFPAAEQANGNWGLVRVCDPENGELFPCKEREVDSPQVAGVEPLPPEQHAVPPPATNAARFLLRSPANKPEPEGPPQ
jgi:hypothetical protein